MLREVVALVPYCTLIYGAVRKSCSVHKYWGDGDAWTVRLHMMGGGRREVRY